MKPGSRTGVPLLDDTSERDAGRQPPARPNGRDHAGTLTIGAERARNLLLVVVAVLSVLTFLAMAARRWVPGSVTAHALWFFDATQEATVPTFFSSLLLLACAGSAAFVAARETGPRARRWWMLAAVFVALSLDETIAFHEATIVPLRHSLEAGSIFYFTWVVPGIAFILAAGFAFRSLIADLSQPQRKAAVSGAVLFFTGALGFELAEGWVVDGYGAKTLALIPLGTVEEALEMVGATLFLYALMLRLEPWSGTLRLRKPLE
jgi:hypothetical protein